MVNRTWKEESLVRLDSLMVAYYVSLCGLPTVGARIKFPMHSAPIVLRVAEQVNQVEKEISNAFFLLLKGLIESRLKEAKFKVNWKSAEYFVQSVCLSWSDMSDEDKRFLSQLCELRNCLAHNYGLVDAKTAEKIPELQIGRYIEMDRQVLKNWFIFSKRIFELVKPKE